MSSRFPSEWECDPPDSFVVGDGPYASALGFVLGTVAVSLERVKAGPPQTRSGALLRVFDNLRWTLLVVPQTMSAAEALRFHQHIWEWVEKLSYEGDQHELAFVFILPASATPTYEETLATGLVLPKVDPATTGHAVWRCSGTLTELLDLLTRTRPQDAVPLRARRASDSRHIAITRLRHALRGHDPALGKEAARAVLGAFRGHEYDLDLFCRPPCHRNGNLLRDWLDASVTGLVTPQMWSELRVRIEDWLVTSPTERR